MGPPQASQARAEAIGGASPLEIFGTKVSAVSMLAMFLKGTPD
jgi:hypothetical protein